jgi:hypothetical protein
LTAETALRDNPKRGTNNNFGLADRGDSVNTVADCTVPEKILLAAYQLENEGQSPFSAEALIVASWQKFPRTFGLKGYADLYPDSNKILSSIMGEKGLARRGWLMKMGQKLYSLTNSGRQVVKRLLEGEEPVPAPRVTVPKAPKISREQEKFLSGLFESTALEKFDEGRKPEITFGDACRFWGITETTHGETLNSRLNRVRTQLSEIDGMLNKGDMELSSGRSISGQDLSHLAGVHEYLEERFARHLNLLRNRVEKTS